MPVGPVPWDYIAGMAAAVVSIGTELTRGELVNTNASWLADQLTTAGLEVAEVACVPDDAGLIGACLERLSASCRAIVCTGGLGPTTDDITSQTVARVLGVPLARDAGSLEVIRARMQRVGRTMASSNEKQADFPEGATVLPNERGTAPGFAVTIGGARAFFMPGVPSEMKAMFAEHVLPELSQLADEPVVQTRLRLFGLPESTVNDRLDGVEAQHGVQIGYRATFPEIEVKVLARDADRAAAEERAARAVADVRERLGDAIFGEGDISYPQAIGQLLREHELTFGTAESCTGGLVARLMTEHPGASDYFQGAIVSYANSVKAELLTVLPETLDEYGAVSEQVARAMAIGAIEALGVDISLSLTGVAGPGGGTEEKPVGLVHYAVATRDGVVSRQRVFPGSRYRIQMLSSYAGLALVRETVLENDL